MADETETPQQSLVHVPTAQFIQMQTALARLEERVSANYHVARAHLQATLAMLIPIIYASVDAEEAADIVREYAERLEQRLAQLPRDMGVHVAEVIPVKTVEDDDENE